MPAPECTAQVTASDGETLAHKLTLLLHSVLEVAVALLAVRRGPGCLGPPRPRVGPRTGA